MALYLEPDDYVVPTRVGVNRLRSGSAPARSCCPHARGGEPAKIEAHDAAVAVVPTRVGVNRLAISWSIMPRRCPHARGGDPLTDLAATSEGVVVPTGVGVNRCRRA